MEAKIIITYRWWHDDVDTIEDSHKIRLKEHAEEHIKLWSEDGYTSGELHLEIDGTYYNGWWEITKEEDCE